MLRSFFHSTGDQPIRFRFDVSIRVRQPFGSGTPDANHRAALPAASDGGTQGLSMWRGKPESGQADVLRPAVPLLRGRRQLQDVSLQRVPQPGRQDHPALGRGSASGQRPRCRQGGSRRQAVLRATDTRGAHRAGGRVTQRQHVHDHLCIIVFLFHHIFIQAISIVGLSVRGQCDEGPSWRRCTCRGIH